MANCQQAFGERPSHAGYDAGISWGGRQATRDTIERAALDLFAAHGVDGTSVESICISAHVSPATFYRYFPTKESVVFAYQAAFLDALDDELAPLLARGDASYGSLALAFAGLLDRTGDLLDARHRIVMQDPALLTTTLAYQRRWEVALAATIERAGGRPAPEAARTAALVVLVLRLALQRAIATGRQVAPAVPEVVRELGQHVLEGAS